MIQELFIDRAELLWAWKEGVLEIALHHVQHGDVARAVRIQQDIYMGLVAELLRLYPAAGRPGGE